MSEVTTESTEIQNEEAEIQAALAGYNKTRGDESSVEVAAEVVVEDEPIVEEVVEAEVSTPTAEEQLRAEMAALKAKVNDFHSQMDPAAVRKMHGEIGNINRTLKKLESAKAEDAPADDELAAALKAAEEAEKEFPELAGPLVKALKTVAKKVATQVADPIERDPVDIDERVSQVVARQRQQDAVEALAEEHPDFRTVRETAEFKAWLSKKTPEFQERFNTTWNPAVVAKGLTEFKDSLKTAKKKQDRLASAVVTPASQTPAKPSTLPDEQGLWVGYNKGPKRHTVR